MRLEEITNGASLDGVEPGRVVTVVAAVSIPPDSLQLVYRLPEGGIREARGRSGSSAATTG